MRFKACGIAAAVLSMVQPFGAPLNPARAITIRDDVAEQHYLAGAERPALAAGRVLTVPREPIPGSGVLVHAGEAAPAVEERRIVVRKGSAVRFRVVNSVVRVGQMGTALQDGAVGDEIPVKLKGSAVSRGRIVSERVVELVL